MITYYYDEMKLKDNSYLMYFTEEENIVFDILFERKTIVTYLEILNALGITNNTRYIKSNMATIRKIITSLRKKLDRKFDIVNIHGKGYELIIKENENAIILHKKRI